MGRKEYDVMKCPTCGIKLPMSSKDLRFWIRNNIGYYPANATIHFLHKIYEKVEEIK